MKLKLLILAFMVIIVAVSVISLVMVLHTSSGKFISTSALDSKLGGRWTLVNEGYISDPTGVSPIIEMLSNSSMRTLYASYYSPEVNLTILVFQYASTSNLPKVVSLIGSIYRDLNWSVRNVTGQFNGICVGSTHYQYLYAYYKNYIILVVLNGTVRPNESLEVASLQQQALG
ncbi:hypothetical protein L3N51_01941 [Metallosphaera sp. J1]|uniref:hypothetical protein n=1 Tax=Metallosphaera javensis (ex Hofmann et al. 2022) TaxID=99938 RepID=UPI001EDDC2FD|nr:hypothetical protein [Metallosphaera javensis (ex Hofmann et al. 2022)]MCG3109646.1 hypothetical protein [Metallosphaera javensis (ex Hofmann et al. 2022)]